MALNNALKDNAKTNRIDRDRQGYDQLMAKHIKLVIVWLIHMKDLKIQQRKQARLQKKIQRQYQKQQQLINFWTKKFCEHIEVNNIYNDNVRKEDQTLQKIETKLIKFGIDTDQLFKERKPRKLVIVFSVLFNLIKYHY